MDTKQRLTVGQSPQARLFADAGMQPPEGPAARRMSSGSPEQRFAADVDIEHRRLRAQFFTPPAMARLMIELAAPQRGEHLLDPACGPGIFVEAARETCPGVHMTAVDIDRRALEYLRDASDRANGTEVVHADFLAWDDPRSFDVLIGNPPYLKYQHFHCDDSVYRRLEAEFGIALSRLSNLYLLFLLEAYRRLRPGGRLVFIVPAEWTNANFGAPFKAFLRREGCLDRLVYFSHLSEQFDDALTTASVIVLRKPLDKHSPQRKFLAFYVDDGASAETVRSALGGQCGAPGVTSRTFDIEVLAGEKKWDHLLRQGMPTKAPHSGQRALGAWCSSRRGIATGANAFFHISRSRAAELRIADHHLVDCVGGSRHVTGVVFDHADHRALVERDHPSVLIDFGASPNGAELRYIAHGERDHLPSRYLLSKRRPWYTMERINPAPVWIGVFGRRGLRAIRNRAGVAHLTTFHGLYPRPANGAEAAAAELLADALVVLLNSQHAQAEALRRRRVYGAGLEKVEPADLLDLLLPDLSLASTAQLTELAQFLGPMDREMREHGRIGADLASALERAVDRLNSSSAREEHALRGVTVELHDAADRYDVCIDPT